MVACLIGILPTVKFGPDSTFSEILLAVDPLTDPDAFLFIFLARLHLVIEFIEGHILGVFGNVMVELVVGRYFMH